MIKTVRTPPPNSVCKQLHMRRQKLVVILDQQIKIADKLSKDTRNYSTEARYAWDIVEELSQKLDKITTRLEECLCEEEAYHLRSEMDLTLSERIYDF